MVANPLDLKILFPDDEVTCSPAIESDLPKILFVGRLIREIRYI